MSNCCDTPNVQVQVKAKAIRAETAPPPKCNCPACGNLAIDVKPATLRQHLQAPWLWIAQPQSYYFCETPACKVVYFGQNGETLSTRDVRTAIGVKDTSPQAVVCYCYGITESDAKANPAIRNFVIAQTKDGACSCTTRNPSGLCCLKRFPK